MKNSKQQKVDSGLSGWLAIIGIILLCVILGRCGNSESNFTPTPESGYKGSCHHWSEAHNWAGSETCIWGFPTSAETSLSGVWLHFSERNHPYPDFAAKITCNSCTSWGFYVSGQNVEKKYSGHCVEVYGRLKLESNTYNNETVSQPIIEVLKSTQIVFCDN